MLPQTGPPGAGTQAGKDHNWQVAMRGLPGIGDRSSGEPEGVQGKGPLQAAQCPRPSRGLAAEASGEAPPRKDAGRRHSRQGIQGGAAREQTGAASHAHPRPLWGEAWCWGCGSDASARAGRLAAPVGPIPTEDPG